MRKKMPKAIVAGLVALATIAPTVASVAPVMSVSAGQVLGESTFDNKALPWHTCETSPAAQTFEFKNKEFHITVTEPVGGEKSKWDLQFRHRNLNFKAGHEYEVSFDVKAKRAGMELCSKIGNIKGDEEYFSLFTDGTMGMGIHMGGQWGSAVTLSTEYQTFKGTFKPTQDLEACEWTFHYANDSNGYGGNAQKGDELFFDNMSIVCKTCDDCDADASNSFGATSRDWAAEKFPEMKVGGKNVNFISVNQVGYYSKLAKTATLGDNAGDVLPNKTTITLSGSYDYELVDASSGTVVHTGKTGTAMKDSDSADTVCKIDFSEYTKPGRYYLRIKGQDWRSFEFNIGDDIYSDASHNLLTNAINYFYQNRSGEDIEAAYITSGDTKTLAHEGGHKTDTASIQDAWVKEYASAEEATGTHKSGSLTANGGWYDAGDHGKYVVNGGISVWTLLNMYERAITVDEAAGKSKFGDDGKTVVIPEKGNGTPDIIDEAMVEIDFMTQMKVSSSDSAWSKYPNLVYHKLHDHKWTGLATRPYDYEQEWGTVRIVKPPTFAATLNYAACAAQAARLLEPYDSGQAAIYLKDAKDCFAAVKEFWYEAAPTEETNKTSLYAPMNQAKGGGPYGDNEVRDDIYWAACELFVTCSELGDADASKYMTELSEYKNAFKTPSRIVGGENVGTGSLTVFNWGNTGSCGSLTLLLHKDLLSDEQLLSLKSSITDTADEYIAMEAKQGYGIPYTYDGDGYTDENNLDASIIIKGYEWGSNSMVINNLIALAYAYDLTGDVKYMNGVTTGMDYLLGNNPMSFSFVSGYGTYMLKNPHHRYWSYELDKTLPMAPDGVLSGGPNAGLQDPYVRALGFTPGVDTNPSQRCYVDSIEAWSTNEVTINWNAPLAWIVSFLQDEAAEADGPVDPGPDPQPGDADWGNVNCSKGESPTERVDVSDAVLLARYLASDKEAAVTSQGLLNADVNVSGAPDADDLAKILQFVAKMIPYTDLGK